MMEQINQPETDSSSFAHRRAGVVALLMAVTIIAILDKTIFAFAGPQIIDTLGLTTRQFGLIGSTFFFLYSISGVLVGFLANKRPARWILAGMSCVWVAAQLLTAAATGFIGLMIGRMLLGAGCGPATPVTQHACFKWYASRERVFPAALIQVAIMLGAIAGALSLPLLIQRTGWRAAYLVLAGVGIIWLALWLRFGREGLQDATDTRQTGGTLPYRRLLLNNTFAFVTLAGFCSYLPTALIYSWVPTYLQRGLQMTPMQSGYVVMAATVGVILLNLIVSALSHRALAGGVSVRVAMIAPPMVACLIAGAAFMAMGFFKHDLTLTLTLYMTGGILVNLLPTFANSAIAFIAPVRQRGSLLAIHIGLMTSAGAIAPSVVSYAIAWQHGNLAHGFELAIGLFGVGLVASSLLGLVLIRPERTRAALEAEMAEMPFPAVEPALAH